MSDVSRGVGGKGVNKVREWGAGSRLFTVAKKGMYALCTVLEQDFFGSPCFHDAVTFGNGQLFGHRGEGGDNEE